MSEKMRSRAAKPWYRADPGYVAIHPGDILAGYRVTRLLGRGGMGEVWAATGDSPERPEVAIKVLLARAALKPDLVKRFEREAKIASAITSPYVCQLLEVASAADGHHLLVFERLTGESLADRLKREQYLPFSEVGPIIDDVLQGLVAAHEAGVVHRDLKPGNIFLVDQAAPSSVASAAAAARAPEDGRQRNERAKILDFGISKLTRREGEREPTLTAFDATLGSFAYMAPEQVRGAARADERADIYAVGAVAFRALSGRLPFEGNTAAVLVAMKLDRTAPSLAQATGEQWPLGIERFLERALERTRERRFDTAAQALEMWRSIQPSALRQSTPPPPPAPAPHSVLAPPSAMPPPSVLPPPAPASRGPRSAPRPREPLHGPRSSSAVIPAPTKPVVGAARSSAPELPPPRSPPVPPLPPPMPPPRPSMPSYEIIEDNPTEVDGPPDMTIDDSALLDEAPPVSAPPPESRQTRKNGRS